MTSTCCKSPVRPAKPNCGQDETNWHVCSECGEACDVIRPIPMTKTCTACLGKGQHSVMAGEYGRGDFIGDADHFVPPNVRMVPCSRCKGTKVEPVVMTPEQEECNGCPSCAPEDYITTVDLSFLRGMRNIYDNAKEQMPDYIAPFWDKEIDRLIAQVVTWNATKPNHNHERRN